jgi:hypothetical protein
MNGSSGRWLRESSESRPGQGKAQSTAKAPGFLSSGVATLEREVKDCYEGDATEEGQHPEPLERIYPMFMENGGAAYNLPSCEIISEPSSIGNIRNFSSQRCTSLGSGC